MTHRFARSLLFLPLLSLSALAADQVVLTNGDTITGAIVKKDGGKLTIKSEFLGEVTMPWTAVKSVRSDSEVTVVLPSGETVKGKLATAGDQLQVAASPAPKSAPLSAVTALRNAAEQQTFERLQHPSISQLWNANFDMGLALARGNARSDTLTNTFAAVRATRIDKISLGFNEIYSTARAGNVNSTIASAIRGGWKYDRNLSPRMFLTGFNDYEHDRFQSLNIRFVGGGGAGVKVVKSDTTKLDFDAGIDYQREDFLDNFNRNSAEANFGDDLLYKVSKVTAITQSARVFANLTDTGTYRLNFDLGSSTVLRKWLAWHVTASDRFLSDPVAGHLRNDFLLTTGLRLTFTH